MVEKRKVRTDFDKTKEYSVDVSKCTEAEKKEVQQAFFDVGNVWVSGGTEYQHLNKVQYTNTTGCGQVTTNCMFGNTTEDCNMTAKEFLELVYEPEQQGHVHAHLMALYAEDAKTTDKPWELWELQHANRTEWIPMKETQQFHSLSTYRRKPKTKLIHGVEVPDISFTPNDGEEFVYPNIYGENYASIIRFYSGYESSEMALKARCCYPHTEEGMKAAILHAKAWLGIA